MATTITEKIAAIDLKIDDLIANPEVDYKIGDKSIKASQKMDQLLKMRESLLKQADADVKIMEFEGFDTNGFGEII